MMIRGAQAPPDVTAVAGLFGPPDALPLRIQAAQVFADDRADGRVPSVRTRPGCRSANSTLAASRITWFRRI